MRELTPKEKILCKTLIDKDQQERHQLRIGDVLSDIYDFECIKKDNFGSSYQDCPFKIQISCISNKRESIEEDLNEAIALLLMLKEKGMLSYIYSKSDECFGDNTPKSYYLSEPEHSESAMLNYFNIDTWQLLDSYYYISNSFKDFVNNDYKTIEQRRHEKEMESMKCTNRIAIVTIIVAVLSLLFSVCSCTHPDNAKGDDNKDTMSFVTKKTPREIMADSIVSLSFQGFTLGKPLSNSLQNAIEGKRVWNVQRKGDITNGNTTIMLLTPNNSLNVSFTIYTYHDTIYHIEYKSSSDRAFGNIAKLYKEKYGSYYSYHYDRPDATYNPNNNEYFTWTFSNQRIEVNELDYVMEIRDYMMKDKEQLKSFLNCRDHSVYVHYTDFSYSQKAHISDSIKREKESFIQEKKQHIQDSTNKVKEEKRKKVAIKQI